MGTFTWPLRISSMDGQQSLEIEATVDTGAAYTTLPASLLRDLGVAPYGQTQVACWPTAGGSSWTMGRPVQPSTAIASRPSWYSEKTTPRP